MTVSAAIEIGLWTGTIRMDLRTEEFELFLAQVRSLQKDLSGVAEFASMERWLSLRLTGDGLGHIRIEGEATDSLVSPNRLSFTFETDQTFLSPLIGDLEVLLEDFPVIGDRPDR